ncbi:MAG: ATP-binding domain-containing protein [Myxococcales bacterium]|nr:ATP-binding domain-containing protein [Myxococcales bacterium]
MTTTRVPVSTVPAPPSDVELRGHAERTGLPTVDDELRLLEVVLDAARKERPTVWNALEAQSELVKLRDALVDEKLAEDRASLLEQMDRVARLVDQQTKIADAPLDIASPYFGHMRLIDDDDNRRDILIGKRTWVKDGIRIVDWRNAPISKVFYQKQEGDDFDIVIADKDLGGEVAMRRTVSIRDGRLERVTAREAIYARSPTGWLVHDQGPALAGGLGSAARPDRIAKAVPGDRGRGEFGTQGDGTGVRSDKFLREIASLLDPDQFRLITEPVPLVSGGKSGASSSRAAPILAIQGSAGSGKTTVALHRVAWLNFQDPSRFAPSRALIVLFSPALASYIAKVLPALGVEGVQVRIYEEWAVEMRRRLFPRLPWDVATDTPAVVTRFKLHSGLLAMLEEGMIAFPELGPQALFEELFTNLDWITRGVARHAKGQFSEGQVRQIHRWCSDRHFVRADGGGHHEDDEPNLDPEDDAILLFLHQSIKGPLQGKKGVPIRYTQLVVDEAQDLSPIELRVLLDTVEPSGAVTLAGDVAQRVLELNDFKDWNEVLRALGREDVVVSPLRISYRSTGPIMRLAFDVLGPLAPVDPAEVPRTGVPPELYRFRSRGEMLTFVADALKRLEKREPQASVALLASREWQCDEAWSVLSRAELKRLNRVRDHEFAFAPGVEIALVRDAKGLEFDYVILLDVDAESYSDSEMARHLLHVGVTRAAHQLWLTSVGTPSPLLPSWLGAVTI